MSVQMAVHPAAAARLAGGIFRRQRFLHRLSGGIQGTDLTLYLTKCFKATVLTKNRKN
jgi:hypothetical protein